MSNQLLTDEIIERYNQGEELEDLLQEHELRTGYTIRIEDLDVERLSKSRRIEKLKNENLRRKLNLVLVIVLLLLLVLIYAIFNW